MVVDETNCLSLDSEVVCSQLGVVAVEDQTGISTGGA